MPNLNPNPKRNLANVIFYLTAS